MKNLFCHDSYEKGDTIAAIATPPGEGGIGIIRISGNDAIGVADKLFSGDVTSYASHTVHFGKIGDIDEGLIVVMQGPRSYTGEDTVEIHCHGGSLITNQVLAATLAAGARAAAPGEFTRRAFENGKIDLTRAEAVQQLIASKSELAMRSAKQQLEGHLHTKVGEMQTALTDVAAILEAWIDFPEEGLEFATQEELLETLRKYRSILTKLADTFLDGKQLHTDLTLCLIGPPNAGKSSLLNALAGKERAIVTNVPGTTRDLIEEEVRIGGMKYRIADTAGIRETDDAIEVEGVKRSHAAAKEADLILYVLDSTQEATLPSLPSEKTILVWNKIDLPNGKPPVHDHVVSLSTKTREGIDELKGAIERVIWKNGAPPKDEIIITQERHHTALSRAAQSLADLISGLESGLSPELLTADMREALLALGTIIGTNITEDLLTSIFSKFCVGK